MENGEVMAPQFLRQLKARAISFEPKEKPILVFGLRRGGSTMLADGISAAKGVWFYNEPYAVLPAHPAYEMKKQLLPEAMHSHFFALRGEALEKFSKYADKLLNAELRNIGTCRNTLFPLKANRVCMKILNAPWMIDWFSSTFNAHIISLVRHPAAQALSVLRQGWQFPLEAYVARAAEIEDSFTTSQIDLMRNTLSYGSKWEVALVDWVVTSHPLRNIPSAPVVRLRYEDIVRDPETVASELLIGKFGLRDRDDILTALGKPSGSAGMSEQATNEAIRSGQKEKLINGWHLAISDEMRLTGSRILDAFEISEYSFNDPRDEALQQTATVS